MVAVRGIYQGGDTVKLDSSPVPVPVQGSYEVVVAFLNPVQQTENPNELAKDQHSRRKEAFEHFMQYRGILPADFDYKKELAEYRDARYGHIN